MRSYGFPQIESHVQEHRRILTAAEALIDDSLRQLALEEVGRYGKRNERYEFSYLTVPNSFADVSATASVLD